MTQTSEPASSTPRHASASGDGSWTIDDAERLYGLHGWGGGFFRINSHGHACVAPRGDRASPRIDLAELVEGLRERGIGAPVLVRFPDILRSRMEEIRGAFDHAIRENSYRAGYACVYPIKVNQQRHVVEAIRDAGDPLGFGLEAGSKPELLAVLGMTEDRPNMPIVCNGFKDDEYVETVILGQKLGRNICPVVEAFHEFELILGHAERYGVRPRLGIRIKPSATGAGRWAESGGERSKFGLHAPELLAVLDRLRKAGLQDCLKMVHFHVGSQMCDIRSIKAAVSELARIYCELRRLGAGIETIDIGGGLAVDYDGSNSTWASSMNYSLEEYANDVVHRIGAACDQAGQPHPMIISESGRAMVAHSSVLIVDVLGRTRFRADPDIAWVESVLDSERAAGVEVPRPVGDLIEAWRMLSGVTNIEDNAAAEAYHDALQARDEAISLFTLGYLSLPLRAVSERLFWAIGRRVIALTTDARPGSGLPDQIEGLPEQLSDIYFGNFSIFQSLPDSWAIEQVFPVLPIHRLDERPTRRAILADVTCDSDGQIDRFSCPDQRDFKPTLELHQLAINDDGSMAEPYLLGIFLVGAYQEVLGDLHNLFGDTHAVHVSADDEAGYRIDEFVEGDTVREVLGYVRFDADDLRRSMRREVESAVRRGSMSVTESRSLLRFYESGLEGYTYLE
ncbi:MAG: biosynthetic arginine decarboxylase [Planctomycetota bacterium]